MDIGMFVPNIFGGNWLQSVAGQKCFFCSLFANSEQMTMLNKTTPSLHQLPQQSMDYQTYTPGSLLQPFVKCYWTLEAPAETAPERQRIVPDGCMEMIFHYGDLYRQYTSPTDSLIQPRCFVFGQITQTLEIAPTGRTGLFSVRFHPDGFTPFASLPVKEMENRAVALETLFGDEGTTLETAMLQATGTEGRMAIIDHFLQQKLSTPQVIDRIAQASVEAILQLKGQVSVDELSEQLNINRRQLERRFASAIGLSPKQLAKIVRLQAALKMLEQGHFTSLTALAYENGYFDQAHFIKDFKEFTGLSPKQFFAGNLTMTALFVGSD
jgi:AraC-like DNA-binding protein